MNVKMATSEKVTSFADTILEQGSDISSKLDMLRQEKFPPNAQKTLRQFSLAEVAEFVGVSQSYLKKLHLQGKGVEPSTTSTGRRYYTAHQMNELRTLLDRAPHRKGAEKLQVLAVVNFKGGSGKTTTAAHLAQYLALRGYRVLAVDLDPQASLTALYGIQPELDQNASFYEALRYDDQRKSIVDIIQPTNFPNLDVVPANLELQEYEYDTPIAMQRKDSNAGKLFYTRIGDALSEVDEQYDVVVVDCPPQLGYLTLTALTAGHHVDVSVPPDARRHPEERRGRRGECFARLVPILDHALRAHRHPTAADGRVHAIHVCPADDEASHGEIDRCFGRRPDEAEPL
jgi:chromosome partitioning protein